MNILLIGKPASGKGTFSKALHDADFVQLSTGDLLRNEIKLETKLGKEIDLLLKDGGFATDEIIFTLVDKFMNENKDKQIIFDGFPRNIAQTKECIKRGIVFDKIIEIDAPDELVKERIVYRRVHPASGRVYNIKTLPPKVEGLDDVTGEALVQRNDDRPEVMEQRLKNYVTLTQPIIGYLKENGYKVVTIDGNVPFETLKKVAVETLGDLAPKKKPKLN